VSESASEAQQLLDGAQGGFLELTQCMKSERKSETTLHTHSMNSETTLHTRTHSSSTSPMNEKQRETGIDIRTALALVGGEHSE
jgi:hypothetical protein